MKILKLPDVIDATGLGRSSIYSYVRAGLFPRPVLIGKRAVGFLKSEISE